MSDTNTATVRDVPRLFWVCYWIAVLMVAFTLTHMQMTAISDNVGFSSNRDFYYSTLHPVRTMLRDAACLAGLVGVALGLFVFFRWSRAAFLNALLVIAGVMAICVFAGLAIVGLALIINMMRSSGNVAEATFVALQVLPSLLALVAIARLFRRNRQVGWLLPVAAALMTLQGLWLFTGGQMTVFAGLLALAGGGALVSFWVVSRAAVRVP